MGEAEPGKSPVGRKILIVLVAIVVSLGIIEVGLRFVLGNCRIVPILAHPGDGRCVALEPGARSTYTGWLFRVPPVAQEANSLGYRGPEVPRERTDGVLRIAVVGDSFTYGQGVAPEETIPARMEAHIREKTGREVEVLNFGIPGLNLEECVDQYRYFASAWKSDIVVYLLFANDLSEPMCDMVGRTTLMWLLQNVYVFRLAYAVFAGGHLISDEVSLQDMVKRLEFNLGSFNTLARTGGTRFVVAVLDNPLGKDKVLAGIAERVGVSYLNVRSAVKTMPREITGEGHYSPEGNDVVAAAIAEWLLATPLIDTVTF